MVSPVKDIAAKYLNALEDPVPTRLPLKPSLKYNANATSHSPMKKHNSPDLDDLARQMNIDTPSRPTLLKSKFETPSATVSSFHTTPRSGSRSLKSLTDTANSGKTSPTKDSLKKLSLIHI